MNLKPKTAGSDQTGQFSGTLGCRPLEAEFGKT